MSLIHELQISQVEAQLQIQRLRNLQAQHEELHRKYMELFEEAPVGYVLLDARGIVHDANQAAAKLSGIEKPLMIHTPISLYTVRGDRYKVHAHVRRALKTGEPQSSEIRLEGRDGAERAVQMDSVPFLREDGSWLCRTTITDITARRQSEAALQKANEVLARRAGVQRTELLLADGRLDHEISQRERIESLYRANNALLHLLGRSLSRSEYCEALVEQIREWSRCRCVGFRILDGRGGIPFEAYSGFGREFWESENALLLERDHCICTRIASGRMESQDMPCVTPAGSFCCNDAAEFIAGVAEANRRRFRGICVEHGYRSLAFVPVQCDGKTLGLIQVADERPGMVRSYMTEFLESLAPLIGEAIRRFELKEALRQNFETQSMLNGLLCMALEDAGLEAILEKALRMLFGIPWLPIEPCGGICLTGRGSGKILARVPGGWRIGPEGCPEALSGSCRCAPGEAFEPFPVQGGDERSPACGNTALRGRDYRVRLTSNEGVLGVVHLRLKDGYRLTKRDEAFFGVMANVLASIVRHGRTVQDLFESGRQLRMLSSRLLSAQEEERKRIAHEIHDSIGASLSAVKLGVQRALDGTGRRGPARDSLEALVSVAQQSIEETRRIMNDLRPPVLDDLGILAAITWFCRSFHEISGLRVETAVEVEERDVPERLKTAVFRIMQEGLNNVAKHSHAERVRLSLKKTVSGLEFMIEDNGCGTDTGAVRLREDGRGGMGLAGMKERTELSGGVFAIRSSKGAGTTIRAFWPNARV
ncbi:MAG: histidine kinase [Syntrophobacteraceae bacterium]